MFYRLRIGIGRPVHGDVRNYVTTNFSKEERLLLDQVISKAASLLEPNTPVPQEVKLK